jgi:hypothetical protein
MTARPIELRLKEKEIPETISSLAVMTPKNVNKYLLKNFKFYGFLLGFIESLKNILASNNIIL